MTIDLMTTKPSCVTISQSLARTNLVPSLKLMAFTWRRKKTVVIKAAA